MNSRLLKTCCVPVLILVPASLAQSDRLPPPPPEAASAACGTEEPRFADRSLIFGTSWPGGVVPIVYDPSVSSANRTKMNSALAAISAQVGVTFPMRTTQPNFVTINNSTLADVSFSSGIGMLGGQQFVSIASTHWNFSGTLIHELGHALGLQHEQCRADRDSYIALNTEKISAAHLPQFAFLPGTPGTQYDLGSVMHYGQTAFTTDGDRTIDVTGANRRYWQYRIGGPTGLSPSDAQALKARYGGSPRPGYTSVVFPALGGVVAPGAAPTFAWTPAVDAASYTFTLGTDPLGVAFDVQITTPDTSVTPAVSLLPNKVYRWTVTATNARGSSPLYPRPYALFYTSAEGAYPRVLYVSKAAAPGGDGLGWSSAFKEMIDAMYVAECSALADDQSRVEEIRVAQGTYKPDRGTLDIYKVFNMYNGLTTRGGYAGVGQPDPDKRDIAAHPTVLSGDLRGDDQPNFVNRSDNTYGVVYGFGVDHTAVMEGFIVRSGTALDYGGGFAADAGSPTIRDCTFVDNVALIAGGGVASVYGSSPVLERCRITGNLCSGNASAAVGGGLAGVYRGTSTLINCVVDGNSARGGGGAAAYNSGLVLRNCVFSGDAATGTGVNAGGAFLMTAAGGSAEVSQCTIAGETSVSGGTMSVGSGTAVDVGNSIIWNTTMPVVTGSGAVSIAFSTVQGGIAGPGNLGSDPLFAGSGNFRLSSGSPAKDSGDTGLIPLGLTTDLDLHPRLIGGGVDRGAYEFACPGDFNFSGLVGAQDIFDFLAAYFSSDSLADFNQSGAVSVQDIFDFLAAYFSGCV